MTLVIDASNILTGGGLTHLSEVIRYAHPQRFGFNKVIVCAGEKALERIEDREWLLKYTHPYLNKNYLFRFIWSNFILKKLLIKENGFLFLVGSVKPFFSWPYVTMCQNLLPVELKELKRFGFSFTTLRLLLLRILHFKAYKNAQGTIFLTQYSYDILPTRIKKYIKAFTVVPHGLNHSIFYPRERAEAMDKTRFKLLYISIINEYKHQDKVLQAVLNLNQKGYAVQLTLIGPAYPASLKKLMTIFERSGTPENVLDYRGMVPYHQLFKEYDAHDAFIFASTCETFGMIVTEAMAMGMPLACSNKSSLPETVGDAAIYFDPENPESIAATITKLVTDDKLRGALAEKSISRAAQFSWQTCADDTFLFLKNCKKS